MIQKIQVEHIVGLLVMACGKLMTVDRLGIELEKMLSLVKT
jgi:hypothetical protein